MADEEPVSGMLHGRSAVQHHVAENHSSGGSAGQKESRKQPARLIERLHSLLCARHVDYDESAIRQQVEAAGLNDATVFLADLEQLSGGRARFIDGVDSVSAPIE